MQSLIAVKYQMASRLHFGNYLLLFLKPYDYLQSNKSYSDMIGQQKRENQKTSSTKNLYPCLQRKTMQNLFPEKQNKKNIDF